jgi:hypothetical protein
LPYVGIKNEKCRAIRPILITLGCTEFVLLLVALILRVYDGLYTSSRAYNPRGNKSDYRCLNLSRKYVYVRNETCSAGGKVVARS